LYRAFAEFQRDTSFENTIKGTNAARRRGKPIGRPPALSSETVVEVYRQHNQKNVPKIELAKRCGVSRSTFARRFIG